MFDTGNTGFMLVATSLVMLMTPGLAFFYGGLVGRKNVLSIMIQSFVSMGVTTIIWWAYGYSLSFSGGEGAIIGNLDKAFLAGVTLTTPSPYGSGNIPEFVFMAYQMMFAIITPALITGAFANRVRFGAYLAFLTLWLTFVYFPFVHMVWGNGLLAKWGVLDFAGGIVVHNIAGMAALASVLYVGRRKVGDDPHFDERRASPKPAVADVADIAGRFGADPAMKGHRLGGLKPRGREVFDPSGKLVGYYR